MAGTFDIIPGKVLTWNELPLFVQNALNQVAKEAGLTSATFTISSGSNVGDGFVSVMLRVVIEGYRLGDSITTKGVKHQMRVIVKLAPFSKARREQFGANALFEREVQMYNDYLPTLERFQLEKGINQRDGLFNFPKCYFASFDGERDETILIMEDLILEEFGLWSKYDPMDYFHASKVVAAIGRFHGLSLAMKTQQPERFEPYKQLGDLLTPMLEVEQMQEMFRSYFDNGINAFAETETSPREKLQKFKDTFIEEFRTLVNPNIAEPYTVINHGDCWINNFMFRKGNGFRPTIMAFIDFQISRYTSPALDLVYFLFTSTDKKLRSVHFEDLLHIYHNSFSNILRRCGEDPEKLFPYEALKQQLKQFGKFGLVMALMVLPVITMRPDEIPDLDKATDLMAKHMNTDPKDAPPEFLELKAKFDESSKRIASRVRDVVEDCIAYGFI